MMGHGVVDTTVQTQHYIDNTKKREELDYDGVKYPDYFSFAQKLIREKAENGKFSADLVYIFRVKSVKNKLLEVLRERVDDFPELLNDVRDTALYYLLSLCQMNKGQNHHSKSICELGAIQAAKKSIGTVSLDQSYEAAMESRDQWHYYAFILRYEWASEADQVSHKLQYHHSVYEFMAKLNINSGTQLLRMLLKLDWKRDDENEAIHTYYRHACGLIKRKFTEHFLLDTDTLLRDWVGKLIKNKKWDDAVRLIAAVDRRALLSRFLFGDSLLLGREIINHVNVNFDRYEHLFSLKMLPIARRLKRFAGNEVFREYFPGGFKIEGRHLDTIKSLTQYLVSPLSKGVSPTDLGPLTGGEKKRPLLMAMLETLSAFPYEFENSLDNLTETLPDRKGLLAFQGSLTKMLPFYGGGTKAWLAHGLEIRCIRDAYHELRKVGLVDKMKDEAVESLSSSARVDRLAFYYEKAEYFYEKQCYASAVYNFYVAAYYVLHDEDNTYAYDKVRNLFNIEMGLIKCFLKLDRKVEATDVWQRARTAYIVTQEDELKTILDSFYEASGVSQEEAKAREFVYHEACCARLAMYSHGYTKVMLYFEIPITSEYFIPARLAIKKLKLTDRNNDFMRHFKAEINQKEKDPIKLEQQRLNFIMKTIKLMAAVDRRTWVAQLMKEHDEIAALLRGDQDVFMHVTPPDQDTLKAYFTEKCQATINEVLGLTTAASVSKKGWFSGWFSQDKTKATELVSVKRFV